MRYIFGDQESFVKLFYFPEISKKCSFNFMYKVEEKKLNLFGANFCLGKNLPLKRPSGNIYYSDKSCHMES